MQLLQELCINTRGSQLPLWVNPSPNAAPKAPTSSVVSPGWDGSAQPAAPDRAPVEEDDEGDADGVALLADADGLQDPRVPQLGLDHVSLKEPRLLGWGWGEASATAWANPTYHVLTHSQCQQGREHRHQQLSPSCCWV